MAANFSINRAIDKPTEFRGLKAQYIIYAGAILVVDIFFFAILYICRVNSWVCVLTSFGLGATAITSIYRICKKYGQYGWAKKEAAKKVPASLRCSSRTIFTKLKTTLCKDH